MDAMPLKACPLTFHDPFGIHLSNRTMDGYVDDTTIWTNDFHYSLHHGDNSFRLTAQLQTSAQWWEEILSTTGGALELSKCFYHILTFKFTSEGKPVLQQPHTFPSPPIRLYDHTTGSASAIDHIPCSSARKTLGVMLTPTLRSDSEYQRLKHKITTLCKLLLPARLTPEETWTYLLGSLRPSLCWSAPVANLSRTQWRKLTAPLIPILLNNMGYPRCFPRAVVYAPIPLGGLGFPDFHVEQGLAHVTQLLSTLRKNTSVSTLLAVTLSWAQRFSGYSESILANPRLPIAHVPSPWLHTTVDHLRRTDCSIRYAIGSVVRLQRVYDRGIMDCTLLLSPSQVKAINRCRLHLQVETLADLCLPNGMYFHPSLFRGIPDLPSEATSKWTFQPSPGPESWATFRKFLRLFTGSSGRLKRPLGPWLSGGPTRRWQHVYCPHSGFLSTLPSKKGFARLLFHQVTERDHYLVCQPNSFEVT